MIQKTAKRPARIRLDPKVWHFILEHDSELTKHVAEKDQLQLKLEKLVHDNPTAQERILVTHDLDLVDQLRDWCARMIGISLHDLKLGPLGNAAGRALDAIDHWESRVR